MRKQSIEYHGAPLFEFPRLKWVFGWGDFAPNQITILKAAYVFFYFSVCTPTGALWYHAIYIDCGIGIFIIQHRYNGNGGVFPKFIIKRKSEKMKNLFLQKFLQRCKAFFDKFKSCCKLTDSFFKATFLLFKTSFFVNFFCPLFH